MNTFARTSSGLRNARHFYQADFTVYIEGKPRPENDSLGNPIDYYFYSNLMAAVRPGKRSKIKVLGNKHAVINYAKRLYDEKIPDSVAIVDKDLEGITSSPLSFLPIIRTVGYSWENELWSIKTVESILVDVIQQPLNDDGLRPAVCLPKLARRLKYLSSLDIGMQVGGKSLLTKTTSLCGVNIKYPNIPSQEISRLSKKYRASNAQSCLVAKHIVNSTKSCEPNEVIQGHFWSNVVRGYMGFVYKKTTKDTAPSHRVFLNLAMAFMSRNINEALGVKLVARYGKELSKWGI